MWVDLVRSCYKTGAYLFADQPSLVTDIYWYKCPPGAKPLPVPSVLSSRNWDDFWTDLNGLGEVWGAPRQWKNGKTAAGVDGLSPCGNRNYFSDGITYDASVNTVRNEDGISLCCLHRVGLLPTFGLLIGFQAETDISQPPAQLGLTVGFQDMHAIHGAGPMLGLKIGFIDTPGITPTTGNLGMEIGFIMDGGTNTPVGQVGLLVGFQADATVDFGPANLGVTIGFLGSGNVGHGLINPGTPNDPVAQQWTLTVASYTGAAAVLNGTWHIPYQSGVTWQVSTLGGVSWTLFYDLVTGWNLRAIAAGGSIQSLYRLSSAIFHGNTGNVLSYVSGVNDTGHFPVQTIIPDFSTVGIVGNGIVLDQGKIDFLRELIAFAGGQDISGLHLHLYTNNATPVHSDALIDFTDAVFGGYTPQTLTYSVDAALDGTFRAFSVADPCVFNNATGAGQTVYGWFLTDVTDSEAFAAGRFTGAPLTIPAGGTLTLNLNTLLDSMF